MLKKLLFVFALAAALSLTASHAHSEPLKVGILRVPSFTEADFRKIVSAGWLWSIFGDNHKSRTFDFCYYDSLPLLLLALDRGDVSEIDVPQPVGEYVIAGNPEYEVSCAMRAKDDVTFHFGFMDNEKGASLKSRFDNALKELAASGRLYALQEQYINKPDYKNLGSAVFERFNGAETVNVVLTGDLPPIDYVAADNRPAGFNTALLSEIGRILKVNFNLISSNTGAKIPTLLSGRADVVFWYHYYDGMAETLDNLLVSSPYFSFNVFLHVKKK